MSSEKTNSSRRDFLVKSMALIPTVVIAGGGVGAIGAAAQAQASGCRRGGKNAGRRGLAAAVLQRAGVLINAAVARSSRPTSWGPARARRGFRSLSIAR